MNILPKKSWHVRNKDNVAKVRKDEENARMQAKELSQRAEAADQEAKINFLRKKAKDRIIKNSNDLTDALQSAIANPTTSNISPAVSISSHAKNEDHEREKKEEQMNYEKKLGVLKYLGQDAAETMNESEKPWYFRAPKRPSTNVKDSDDEDEADEKDKKRKSSLDPMNAIKVHLQEKKASEKKKKDKKKKTKHKLKKMPKHHREEKERRLDTNNDKLAKLRKERLEREKKEKERSRILISGDDKTATEPAPQRYHSQYNPHLSRNRNRY